MNPSCELKHTLLELVSRSDPQTEKRLGAAARQRLESFWAVVNLNDKTKQLWCGAEIQVQIRSNRVCDWRTDTRARCPEKHTQTIDYRWETLVFSLRRQKQKLLGTEKARKTFFFLSSVLIQTVLNVVPVCELFDTSNPQWTKSSSSSCRSSGDKIKGII